MTCYLIRAEAKGRCLDDMIVTAMGECETNTLVGPVTFDAVKRGKVGGVLTLFGDSSYLYNDVPEKVDIRDDSSSVTIEDRLRLL